MSHRSRIPLEIKLERARDRISAQAGEVRAEYARLLAAARRFRADPAAAGEALEEIAVRRLYRLDGHASLAAFARAELDVSRATCTRIRAAAPSKRAREKEVDAPATEARRALSRWLRARGARALEITVVRRRGVPSVQVVLSARDAARVVGKGRR